MDKFEFKHSFFFFFFSLVLGPLVLNLGTVPLVAAEDEEVRPFDYLKLATEAALVEEEAEPLIDYLKLPTVQPVAAPAKPFDYYRLALFWAPSVWKRSGPAPVRFTIHGLWPDNKQGPNVEYCDGPNFQPIKNQGLLDRMNEDWPYPEGTGNSKLWSIGWKKHGTCSLLTQIPYLERALTLYDIYDSEAILEQLEKDKIVPNNTGKIAMKDMKSSIKKLTSGEPDILCTKSRVQEIRICFKPDGSGTVIDCPEHHSANCRGKNRFPATI